MAVVLDTGHRLDRVTHLVVHLRTDLNSRPVRSHRLARKEDSYNVIFFKEEDIDNTSMN